MSEKEKALVEKLVNSVDESRRKALKRLLIGGLTLAAPGSASVALGQSSPAKKKAAKKKKAKKKATKKKKAAKKKKKTAKKKKTTKKKAAKKKK